MECFKSEGSLTRMVEKFALNFNGSINFKLSNQFRFMYISLSTFKDCCQTYQFSVQPMFSFASKKASVK